VDGIGCGSYPLSSFGIGGLAPLFSASRELVNI
jgi:hypothetical protein